MKTPRGRAHYFRLPVLWELGVEFFQGFLFLAFFFFFVTVNSVNTAAKGLISRLWCSGTDVQWVTIQSYQTCIVCIVVQTRFVVWSVFRIN